MDCERSECFYWSYGAGRALTWRLVAAGEELLKLLHSSVTTANFHVHRIRKDRFSGSIGL